MLWYLLILLLTRAILGVERYFTPLAAVEPVRLL